MAWPNNNLFNEFYRIEPNIQKKKKYLAKDARTNKDRRAHVHAMLMGPAMGRQGGGNHLPTDGPQGPR